RPSENRSSMLTFCPQPCSRPCSACIYLNGKPKASSKITTTTGAEKPPPSPPPFATSPISRPRVSRNLLPTTPANSSARPPAPNPVGLWRLKSFFEVLAPGWRPLISLASDRRKVVPSSHAKHPQTFPWQLLLGRTCHH